VDYPHQAVEPNKDSAFRVASVGYLAWPGCLNFSFDYD